MERSQVKPGQTPACVVARHDCREDGCACSCHAPTGERSQERGKGSGGERPAASGASRLTPEAQEEIARLREALKGEPCTWGRDLAELLEWVAQRREWEAAQEDAEECVAPVLRKAAMKIRAALSEPR